MRTETESSSRPACAAGSTTFDFGAAGDALDAFNGSGDGLDLPFQPPSGLPHFCN